MPPVQLSDQKKGLIILLTPILLIGCVMLFIELSGCEKLRSKVSVLNTGCVDTKQMESCWCGMAERVISVKTDCTMVGPASGAVMEDKE